MLKQSASFVLGSSKSSTYPRGYASGFDSPPALLDELFEHPASVKREMCEKGAIRSSELNPAPLPLCLTDQTNQTN